MHTPPPAHLPDSSQPDVNNPEWNSIPDFLGHSPGSDLKTKNSFTAAFEFFQQGSHKIVLQHKEHRGILLACALNASFNRNIENEIAAYQRMADHGLRHA